MVQSYQFVLLLTTLLTLSSSIQENLLGDIPQKYIVQVRYELKPSVLLDVKIWYCSILDSIQPIDTQTSKHPDIHHVYKTVVHGFVTELTAHQVELIKERPEVLAIYANQALKLHTTHTSEFLGLISRNGITSNQLLKKSDYGSNIVIGVLDTGIWPERPSFSDDGLGSIPNHWKGDCMGGNNFTVNQCNKKLIGAQFFNTGISFDEWNGFNSARDTEGHGTFTSSIAAGSNVPNATLFGYALGNASGVAPKARIAVYKVCWPNLGCPQVDIVAAYDKAVRDGVDIISFSIDSGSERFHENPIAIV
ncbi:Subtilisin-like protease SBT1.4 [Thalictrum thalictroides]|uniref:Subtilisin-like protease SBT1.4 n=1 Tax=Thalictrum thalictroides TaxID=46969 RepID=A0A7J6V6G6_THATH|nr:Subtilisin-like protease SBT1.4 [Thalictrum thalictroides]